MELAEYLLDHMQRTTSAYQELQDKEARLASDLALAQAQLFPLRKENSRLTRENHQLHLDNIRQQDEASNMFADQGVNMRKLKDEIADMSLVMKLKDEELRNMESEKDRIKEAYEDLADPSMKSKGAKRMMKISKFLPPAQKVEKTDKELTLTPSDDMLVKEDAKIIESLRHQLDEADRMRKTHEAEIARLGQAVHNREMELARTSRASDVGEGTTRLEQLAAADASNKRIIDQLNGQVDFLNEQLALREAQIVDFSAKVEAADEVTLRFAATSSKLERLETENATLSTQLRVLENKVEDLELSADPEGDVTLDELFDATSAHSAKAVQEMLESTSSQVYAHGETKVDVSTTSTLKTGQKAPAKGGKPRVARKSAVASPEQARMSGAGKKSGATGGSSNPIDEQIRALDARSKQLEKEGRKIVGGARRGGVDHSVDMNLFTREEHDNVVAELKSQIVELEEDNERLRELFEGMQGGEAVIKERLRKGEERIAELRDQLTAAEQQADTLALEVQRKDDYISAREVEYSDLQRRLEEAAAKIGNSTSSALETSARSSQLEFALNEANNENKRLTSMCETYSSDLSLIRAERLDLMMAKEELEAKDRVMSRDLAKLREIGNKSSAELTECRSELVKAQITIDNLSASAESNARKASSAEEHAELMSTELSKAKAMLTESVAELAKYQMSEAPGNVAEALRNDMMVLRQKCDLLEEAELGWKRERMSLNDTLQDMTRRQNLHDELRQQTERDHEQLVEEIVEKNDVILELQREKQKLEMQGDRMAMQLRNQEASISSLNAAARERSDEVNESMNASQILNADISMLSKRCVDAEEAYESARGQADKESRMLAAATRRAGEAETQVDSLTALVAANQEEISSLQAKLTLAKDELEAAKRKADNETSSVHQALDREMALQRTVAELKVAVASAEKDSRAQALKNTRLLASLNEGEDATSKLHGEVKSLQEVVAEKDGRINELLSSLKSLDTARDAMQSELDQYQENDISLRKEVAAVANRDGQTTKVLEQTERKLREVSDDLASTRRACKELDARIVALREENAELKRRYGMRNADVAGATEDLMLMTKENQALTTELADVTTERDRLRGKIQELMARLHTTDQGKRALEIERNDLIDTYRIVLGDKRKVENELNALGQAKQQSGISLQQMQEQVSDLKGIVESSQAQEKRLVTERSTFMRQLEGANDELVRSRNRTEAVEADNRRLMQDTHALRQTNVMLKERVEMVVKRATHASDANKILSSRLSAVERERDAVRALVAAERRKSEEYGTLIEGARAQVAQKELQLARQVGAEVGESSISNAGESSASSAAAAAASAALNASLGLSEEDSLQSASSPQVHHPKDA